MTLTENEIDNISALYMRENNMWENLPNLVDILEWYGNNMFYIYRKLCQIRNWLFVSNQKQFTCQILSKKQHIFLRKLSKVCFIKVIKRKKIIMSLRSIYDDGILFAIFIYKQNFNQYFVKFVYWQYYSILPIFNSITLHENGSDPSIVSLMKSRTIAQTIR